MREQGRWGKIEMYVRISFWGLNAGLALMVILNLFPGGILQLSDVLQNGYWHPRGPAFLQVRTIHRIEWLRMPADVVFIALGVLPMLAATVRTLWMILGEPPTESPMLEAGPEPTVSPH